jgi:hypothetical protein
MAKITSDIILKADTEFANVNEFMRFLIANRHLDENTAILKDSSIPDYIKNVIYIIDYDTVYGIYDNGNEELLERTINAFSEAGHNEMAENIMKLSGLIKSNNKNTKIEIAIEKKLDSIRNEQYEYWEKVRQYIKKKHKEQ